MINGVKYFAIFVGFGRGGTTLVGALLDGHPNIVLGTDYQLFIKWPQERRYHQDTANLYTALYRYSVVFARYFRKNKAKGYSFNLKGGFNGRYSNSISVIGAKEAGSATVLYMNEHHQWMQTVRELQETVKVPIKAVQVRNMTIICSVVFVSARFSVCVNVAGGELSSFYFMQQSTEKFPFQFYSILQYMYAAACLYIYILNCQATHAHI